VIECNEWKRERERKTPQMHKYRESKTIQIMAAIECHITSDSGIRKFQAA